MIGPEALHKELLELDGIEVIDSSIHNGLIAAPRDFQNVEVRSCLLACPAVVSLVTCFPSIRRSRPDSLFSIAGC